MKIIDFNIDISWIQYSGARSVRYFTKVDSNIIKLLNGEIYSTIKVKAIKIDKYILDSCGYKYIKEIDSYANNNHLVVISDNGIVSFQPFCTNDRDCHFKINYLHELQNLHLVFDNKELDVKIKNTEIAFF